ncbi:hypothetical protein ACFFKC_16395 [Pseudoduganella danionis]|uniref:MarR family transcriptional regulator n=1 Tax=Pseudoduganella danionis TaxID=1890295 RepID=A0ABW9SPC6_9BURK|nr:hypothetical protein [Pseudoduganella danionis]MTW33471.1 hypothetical protein [Pseudoduganella danionis]
MKKNSIRTIAPHLTQATAEAVDLSASELSLVLALRRLPETVRNTIDAVVQIQDERFRKAARPSLRVIQGGHATASEVAQ